MEEAHTSAVVVLPLDAVFEAFRDRDRALARLDVQTAIPEPLLNQAEVHPSYEDAKRAEDIARAIISRS